MHGPVPSPGEAGTTTKGEGMKPRNTKELDAWIQAHPQKEPKLYRNGKPNPHAGEIYHMSRWMALVRLFGEQRAAVAMRNLEVQIWNMSRGGMGPRHAAD